jgi:septal ring factor EnvC (AmiA/AmiB activator)
MSSPGRIAGRSALLALALLAVAPARALSPGANGAAAPAGDPTSEKQAEKLTRQLELQAIERTLQASAETKAQRDAAVEALRSDRAKLNQALIDTTQRLRDTDSRIGEIEDRLNTLGYSETAIRRSLDARRGVIVEVLAALQRMGRRPPPAVLVKPEDMLEAVRSSMLLGAVLPELRSETEALATDLSELVRLRRQAQIEKDALARDVTALVDDRQKLAALVEARQKDLAMAEKGSAEEGQKAALLASRAASLKDLIGRLEGEIDSASRAARDAEDAARRAEEESRRATETQARETRDKIAALAFRDPARIAPKIAFAETRGFLPLPVSGSIVKAFATPDGVGGTSKGVSYGTRPGAVVSSPADGWVVFAGPFRSYGQLLIINAGGGYYLLLAGMERINVGLGQFVLAGEPVAVMGESSRPSLASAGEITQPVLYIEFRKDGTSIDPSPWWATSTHEKVRG